eukprot:Gb_05036 [translate_table: standard]
MRLEGKVAIITGGGSGIGEASVKLFAENGAKVVIADIQDELGSRLADSLGPSQASYFHCDVSKEGDVSALVDYTLEKHGQLDIMFSNAGIAGRIFSSMEEVSVEDFESVISVNMLGAYLCTKHATRAMLGKSKGCILYTASIVSILGANGSPAYCASKHAVVGLMKSAASDLASYGIRVNCVSPARVPTPMLVSAMRYKLAAPSLDTKSVGDLSEIMGELKGVRFEPVDVARAALFLSSEEARYISGHNLVIDGAFSSSKRFSTSNPMDFLPLKSFLGELAARPVASADASPSVGQKSMEAKTLPE